MRNLKHKTWKTYFGYGVLLLWAGMSLLPLFWMFVSAFTPSSTLMRVPPEINIQNFSLHNFLRLLGIHPDYPFVGAPIFNWFANTLVVAAVVTAYNVFFDTLAGYTFAKRSFPGRTLIFWIILSTMMIPGQVTLVPLFIMTMQFGLIDSHLGVIMPGLAGVFGIFLMKQFIQTLPSALEDAARIDGCSEFGIFWRVILPLCKPSMAVLSILTFMAQWNNFLWPMVVINTVSKNLLQPGLATLQQQYTTDYGLLMAGAALSAVPMIVVFFSFQKFFIKGLTLGGVKG